jgi:predicted ester cyclase
MCVSSRTELEYQLSDRAGGLSNVDFTVDRVEELSTGWVATWRVAGDHTGDLLFNEDVYFPPSGRRIVVSATTHLVLEDQRISAFRTSYDDKDVAAQLRGETAT